MNAKIKFNACRAIDSLEICQRYFEGHMKLLEAFKITKITSANKEWMDNPNTYVITAESEDNKILGGVRIQVADVNYPLPVEDAVGIFDKGIYSLVNQCSKEGAAELCGLWNSREVAGMGIGSIFLSRVAVVVANLLDLNYLFVLCAPYTVKMAINTGFLMETSLGKDGTFYYPKEDLLASLLILNDVKIMKHATEENRNYVYAVRKDKFQKRIERGPKGEFEAQYNLNISKCQIPAIIKPNA